MQEVKKINQRKVDHETVKLLKEVLEKADQSFRLFACLSVPMRNLLTHRILLRSMQISFSPINEKLPESSQAEISLFGPGINITEEKVKRVSYAYAGPIQDHRLKA